jgi:hypothetical protein
MNGHRALAHDAPRVTLEDMQGFETCEANKSGPKKSYQQVPVTVVTPVVEDFRV